VIVFTDGGPRLQTIIIDAGLTKPPIADWPTAVRLHRSSAAVSVPVPATASNACPSLCGLDIADTNLEMPFVIMTAADESRIDGDSD
jgi:hypothetical protein